MLFSSLPFQLWFLPLFFILYFLLRKRSHRNIVLLAFSVFFYAWGEPVYVILMVLSLAVNWYFALAIEKVRAHVQGEDGSRSDRLIMIVAVIVNLVIIGVFKYASFFASIFTGHTVDFKIALPIGISFYTFQILSYVIDVYKKSVPAQGNILFLGAYLFGFPQLIAGPIVRYETIADELVSRKETLEDFSEGMRRFIAGIAKKVLIANTVAQTCDLILGNENMQTVGAVGMWIAVISYALQIYFDFSGYSDMAIGLGRMMGFHYLENFNYPYIAKSVTDFWRRWHISLSSFFRDYVYIPLGGNRVSSRRWVLNMMIVWLLTGLWHGANFTFVLWGVYYGILLIIEKKLLSNTLLKIRGVNRVYTIAAFLFGWVLFRADSVAHIGTMFKAMFGGFGAGDFAGLASAGAIKPFGLVYILIGIIAATPVLKKIKVYIEGKTALLYAADFASVVLLLYCIITLATSSYNPFIYFRF